MMHMMDNPVAAMMVLVGLIVVLAALTIGLRLLGGLDGRSRPAAPQASTAPPAFEAPMEPPSLDQ